MDIGRIEEIGVIEPIEEPRLEPVPQEAPPGVVPARHEVSPVPVR